MMYTSRVPRVATRPVLAPFRSMSVLMAMVEPWISSSITAAASPLLRMQSMTPCPSCAGVVRLLACTKRRSASSNPIRSVKVPPISMATTSTLGDSNAPHPRTYAAPGTRSGFQRCAGLPHRAGHGQALENQRYFNKRQGPQETANADVACGCGDDLFAARGGGRARGELPDQTGDDHRAGGARRGDRRARPHAGAAFHRSLGPAG